MRNAPLRRAWGTACLAVGAQGPGQLPGGHTRARWGSGAFAEAGGVQLARHITRGVRWAPKIAAGQQQPACRAHGRRSWVRAPRSAKYAPEGPSRACEAGWRDGHRRLACQWGRSQLRALVPGPIVRLCDRIIIL